MFYRCSTNQVTSQLFEPTWTHWMQDTSALLRGLSRAATAAGLSPATSAMGGTFAEAAGGSPGGGATGGGWSEEEGRELLRVCERWRYCLKSLRCMVVFGFPSDVKAVQEVTVLHRVVPAFLEASSALLNYCKCGCRHINWWRCSKIGQVVSEKL